MKKREDPFVLENSAFQTVKINALRKAESSYGVVISSESHNKTTTKVRVLFFPQGKIDLVAKSRLDFAESPTDVTDASPKFLENLNYHE